MMLQSFQELFCMSMLAWYTQAHTDCSSWCRSLLWPPTFMHLATKASTTLPSSLSAQKGVSDSAFDCLLWVLQKHAAQGREPDSTPLHICQCPPCFTAFEKSNGQIDCVPKCDLATCDEDTGVCTEAGGKGRHQAHSPCVPASALQIGQHWHCGVACDACGCIVLIYTHKLEAGPVSGGKIMHFVSFTSQACLCGM